MYVSFSRGECRHEEIRPLTAFLSGTAEPIVARQAGNLSVATYYSIERPGEFLTLSSWTGKAEYEAFRSSPDHLIIEEGMTKHDVQTHYSGRFKR